MRRDFGPYKLLTFNDPAWYLDALYGNEWRSTWRVYAHQIHGVTGALAYNKRDEKRYHIVEREEYEGLAAIWKANENDNDVQTSNTNRRRF